MATAAGSEERLACGTAGSDLRPVWAGIQHNDGHGGDVAGLDSAEAVAGEPELSDYSAGVRDLGVEGFGGEQVDDGLRVLGMVAGKGKGRMDRVVAAPFDFGEGECSSCVC